MDCLDRTPANAAEQIMVDEFGFYARSAAKQKKWAAEDAIGAECWWVIRATNLPTGCAATYMRRDGSSSTRVVDEVPWFKKQLGAENSIVRCPGITIEWKPVRLRFTAKQVKRHQESLHV
jgi:hypothetical protein